MEELQSWWEVPTIAHFCSLFRAAFSLLDFDIEELEEALVNDCGEEKSSFLQDLLIRLLSGCYQRHDITGDNLEKYLQDFVKHRWAHEKGKENVLQDNTFQRLSLRLKVEILHCMCDARLDAPDVAEVLKNLESDSLRVESLGTDDNDSTYWYFYGTRLYREDPVPSKAEKLEKQKEIERKKKEKEKEKKRKRKDKKKKRGKGRPRKNEKQSSSESEPDEEAAEKMDEDAPAAAPSTSWHVVCSTEDDWKELAAKFEKSKSRCERDLYRTITVDFLPEIGRMIAEREKAQKRKSVDVVPRRTSQRISQIRRQREEVERIATEVMVEEQKQLLQEIDSRKYQMLDQERRQLEAKMREERFIERQQAKEEGPTTLGDLTRKMNCIAERAKRAQLRDERAKLISEGKDVPTHLRHSSKHGRRRNNDLMQESQEELYTGMFKVFEAIHTHPNAWPFAQPVNEEYAPGYYSVVKVPMDLSSIEERLQHQKYHSIKEFEDDVRLMLDNCRKYNGIDSEYTKMAEVLRAVFKKAMKRYFPTESSDEDESTMANDSSDISTSTPSSTPAPRVPTRPTVPKPLELWSQAVKSTTSYSLTRTPSLMVSGSRYSAGSNSSAGSAQGSNSLYLSDPSKPRAAASASTNESSSSTLGQPRQPIYTPGGSQKIIIVQRKGQDATRTITVPTSQIRSNTQIPSRSLDAVNKMAVSMPENQRQSFLNFTAMYQASLNVGQNVAKKTANLGSGATPLLVLSQKTANSTTATSTTQPLLVLRGSIPSAALASSTSSASTTASMETKTVFTISPSLAATARPTSAIPVKKRAYMGTSTTAVTNVVQTTTPQVAASFTKPEVKPATPVRPLESSEAVKRKWMESLQNKLGANSPNKMRISSITAASQDSPRSATMVASINNIVRKGPAVVSANLRQVELLNSQRKSVIATVPAVAPAAQLPNKDKTEKKPAAAAEGLAVKFFQTNSSGGNVSSTARMNNGGVPVANVQPNVNHGVATSNYVQLPRGDPPGAETFVRTMNSVNSQNVTGLSQNAQASMPARASILQSQRPQQQVMIVRRSSPGAGNYATTQVVSSTAPTASYVISSPQQQQRMPRAAQSLLMTSVPQSASHHQQQQQQQQQTVRYQFSMPGVNPLVNNGSSERRLMAAVPAMPRQTPQQHHDAQTVVFSKPSLSSSSQSASVSSSQVQYVDNSGRRYTRVGSNFVQVQSPVQPQPQPQQVFYIQQPGQVILQQQVLTQPYSSAAPVQHLSVGQKNVVTIPSSSQHTYLTSPQSVVQTTSAPVPNGTNFHYYSALPHQPTS